MTRRIIAVFITAIATVTILAGCTRSVAGTPVHAGDPQRQENSAQQYPNLLRECDVLDLEFDQEQELLRQTVREVLQRHCGLDVIRSMEDDPVGYPPELWSQLGQLDLTGLLLPPEYGGSGMSLIEAVALYEGR